MSWNYRLLAYEDIDKEVYLHIREVYYDRQGEPYGHSDASVIADDVKGILEVLEWMSYAIEKPILWAGDKFPKEYKKDE